MPNPATDPEMEARADQALNNPERLTVSAIQGLLFEAQPAGISPRKHEQLKALAGILNTEPGWYVSRYLKPFEGADLERLERAGILRKAGDVAARLWYWARADDGVDQDSPAVMACAPSAK